MTWLRDVSQAVRSLFKHPGFAATAIGTLALGIGATAAIFSVVQAVLLQPLPYPNADRLMHIAQDMRARDVVDFPIAPGDFHDFRQMTDTFESVGSVFTFRQTFIGDGAGLQTEQAPVAIVSTSLPEVLGFRVSRGRAFVAEDGAPLPPQPIDPVTGQTLPPQTPPPPQAVMLSESFFARRFGSDPSVVGTVRQLGGQPVLIVGVLEEGSELLFPPALGVDRTPDVWIADRTDFANGSRINVALRVVARLKAGVTRTDAQAAIDRIGADLRERFPIKQTAGVFFRVEPLHEDLVADVRTVVWALMGAVAFVLLIACANVANLMLVRTAARERDLAIRTALGGARWRLMRELLLEGLVMSLVASAVGLLLAQALVRGLRALGPENLPRLDQVTVDPVVVAFGVALAVASTMVFATLPAIRGSRPDVIDILRRSGRSDGLGQGRWLRDAVAVAEVALCFVLLVGSGLMVRSFVAIMNANPGFDAKQLFTFQLTGQGQAAQGPAGVRALQNDIRTRLEALPGVSGVALSTYLPLTGAPQPLTRYGREDALSDPARFQQGNNVLVSPNYFEVMGARVIDGRAFTEADNVPQPQSVLIDSLLADKMFPGERAVGQRLYVRTQRNEPDPFTIIGVVSHLRDVSPAANGREAIYFPEAVVGAPGRWALRVTGEPAAIEAAVRREIAAVSPALGVFEARTMEQWIGESAAGTRFVLWLLSVFAGVAMVLAAVGLYSVLSTSVRQRTAEIGVRMAFGAQARSIFSLVVGHGLILSGIGVLIGVPAAVLLSQAIGASLVDVSPTDPLTYAALAAAFLVVAAVACAVPALRAARLDPLKALRQE